MIVKYSIEKKKADVLKKLFFIITTSSLAENLTLKCNNLVIH